VKLVLLMACLLAGSGLDQRARWEQWVELGLHRPVLAEAETAFDSASRDPELLALAARAAAASGELERAGRWLASAEGPAIQLERARLHLMGDRIDEALALLLLPGEPPRPRHPERGDSWVLAGRALARVGELERARPLLEQAIARFPHDDEAPATLHLLARAAIARGDLQGARRLRDRATRSARWRAFFDARRRQALEHPDDPLPRFGIATLWMEVDEAARALDVLDALLAGAPDFVRAHALRGDAARALGDLETSLAAWSRALELDGDLHAARMNRAILHVGRENWSAAREDLEILVSLEEARVEPLLRAHLLFATVLDALGDAEGARAARERHEALVGS